MGTVTQLADKRAERNARLPVRTGDPAPQSPGDARLLAAARARGYGSAREMFRAHSAAALAARTGPS